MEVPFEIREFFHNFLIYHYLFFGFLFLFSILLLVLGVVFRKKSKLSFLFYFSSFLSLFFAPFVGSFYLEEYLRGVTLQNMKVSRLVYTEAIVVSAKLHNKGRVPLNTTHLLFSVVKKDNNSIREFVNVLRPVKTDKITMQEIVAPGESIDIRAVLDISQIKEPNRYAIYYKLKSF